MAEKKETKYDKIKENMNSHIYLLKTNIMNQVESERITRLLGLE